MGPDGMGEVVFYRTRIALPVIYRTLRMYRTFPVAFGIWVGKSTPHTPCLDGGGARE